MQEILNKPIKNLNYKSQRKQISMVYGCASQIYKLHRFVLFEICIHRFVLFKHKCHALFEHKNHVHDFCV